MKDRLIGADSWRETAHFDVSVSDYRDAMALAAASDRTLDPSPFRKSLKGVLPFWTWLSLVLWVASVLKTVVQNWDLGSGAIFEALGAMIPGTLRVELGITGIALLCAASSLLMQSNWRKRLPREVAQWKRPQRMCMRWDDRGITLAGERGFSSVGWHMLYAWLDAPAKLILFVDATDPIPIPHQALGAEDLDDLRDRLTAHRVAPRWHMETLDARQLRMTFR